MPSGDRQPNLALSSESLLEERKALFVSPVRRQELLKEQAPALDVFERLNRNFGAWYEGLFGASETADLRPRDILRRITQALEDNRREGLDGQVYVPNRFTLDIAPRDDEERHYLRTFLDADELAAAVGRTIEQHQYKTRGGLDFTIEEVPQADLGQDRVRVRCRFDASVPAAARSPRPAPAAVAAPPRPLPDNHNDQDHEPGTIPAGGGAAGATLVVKSAPAGGAESGAVFPLGARPALQIGRGQQAGNDIVLGGDTMISKRHARITRTVAEGHLLHDLGSTNGTLVNGTLVASDGAALRHGDEIRLGETVLIFGAATNGVAFPAARLFPFQAAPSSARLVTGDGETFPLASAMTVGRALTSDIVLIGDGVAAQHALITVQGDGKVLVEDLNSTAGTFVNGERVPPRFPVALYESDQVAFGSVQLRLERTTR